MAAGPIRVGLVGLGRAGWGMHCEELRGRESMFQIVAACDLIPERRARMAERYGCSTYEQVEELVRDPQVELVDIATRSCDHFDHARLALSAGKHVFLEKPMCTSYAQARRLQRLAASPKTKGKLFIRHNRRFEPTFQHIREIMASGVLGEVYEIKLRRVGYQRRDDWQTLKAFGGGQLLNWGPHIVDHALRFLDAPLARFSSHLRRVAAVGDAEDHLKLLFTGANGRTIDLEISGGAALGEPEYLVWGTKGALSATGNTISLKYLDPDAALAPRRADPGTPGAGFGSPDKLPWIEKTLQANPRRPADMTSIWDELFLSIRRGRRFPITLDEAVEVMRVISLARRGTEFA
jgi:predicted dehydrogenase